GVQSRHHVVAVGAELLGVDGDDEVLVGAAWPLGHVLPADARDLPQALPVPLGDPGPSLYPVFQMPEGDEHQRGVQFGEAGVEPGEPGVVVAGVAVVAGEADPVCELVVVGGDETPFGAVIGSASCRASIAL